MGTQQVVERILSDAQTEAQAIVEEAEAKAAKLLADASVRAETAAKQAETDMQEKRRSILEKKAAVARLDSAKLLLNEKRKVLDTVYDEALSRLIELRKEDCVRLFAALLEKYAENGDEICFAEHFKYDEEIKILPVVKEKGLKISPFRVKMDGGMLLKGEKSDKDLSFAAILATDRDRYQAELAKEIFK